MMTLFRDDNTTGYRPADLDALNAEWEARAAVAALDEFTEEYNDAAQAFCDEVSSRN